MSNTEEYIIKCTAPARGRNIKERQDMKHPKCNSPNFIVKFDAKNQIANVMCARCGFPLFEYKLESKPISEMIEQPKTEITEEKEVKSE